MRRLKDAIWVVWEGWIASYFIFKDKVKKMEKRKSYRIFRALVEFGALIVLFPIISLMALADSEGNK